MDIQRPKVGVGVIVLRQSMVLLGKRRGAHGAGTWSFPGGHLERNEDVENCARRETREEAGITICNLRRGPYTNDINREENVHYITLYVVADYESGEVRVCEPERCEVWKWFSWGDFPRPLFLPVSNLLRSGFSLQAS